MGLFDSVYVDCPHCGKQVEFQSKAGDCSMSVYSLDSAPSYVVRDILNEPMHCGACGGWMALIDPQYPIKPPPPKPTIEKVKSPAKPVSHGKWTWWEGPFTEQDLER